MVWKRGESGNSKGRPRTDASVGRAALRDKLLKRVPAIIKKLEEQALAGDVQAAKTLLDRVLPAVKPESLSISLPGVAEAATATLQAQLIVKAVAAGAIPPDVGAQLLTGIGQAARVMEIDELARRIQELEGRSTP